MGHFGTFRENKRMPQGSRAKMAHLEYRNNHVSTYTLKSYDKYKIGINLALL